MAVVTLRETRTPSTALPPPTIVRMPRMRCFARCAIESGPRSARAGPEFGGTCSTWDAGREPTWVYSAAKGYRVTAIDWSAAMVDEARRVVKQAGLHDRVRVLPPRDRSARHLERHGCRSVRRGCCVSGVQSRGGPAAFGARIAGRVRAGGFLVASVIGRACPWEFALYTSRGDVGRAAIRFARRPVAVPLRGEPCGAVLHTVGGLTSVREGRIRIVLDACSWSLHPASLFERVRRPAPSLIAGLQRIEDTAGGWPGFRALGDHFLIVMRRA